MEGDDIKMGRNSVNQRILRETIRKLRESNGTNDIMIHERSSYGEDEGEKTHYEEGDQFLE